ncbi:MAG TPA: acetyl-CoA C-acetyltransferase [Anaerolineae bacterium]|nr:acetyl-CoA C-acetyltransferase [Anaerolineae bacterium]
MTEVVIVSGARTAIGTFGGSLKDVAVVELGALVIKEALKRAGLRPSPGEKLLSYAPVTLAGTGIIDLEARYYDWDQSLQATQIDEVIMGHVIQAGQGQNTARQAMMRAGVSKETNAFTVNKVCGSGLKAITLGAQAIQLGQAEVVVAGGMENMSQAPYGLPKARWGYRMDVTGAGVTTDLMVYDGLWEIFYGYHMGLTAENIAEKYSISREEQDQLGLVSHQRARRAITDGTFAAEIVPVVMPQRKGDPVVFDTDERPMDTSLEKMAKLAPAFKKEGTVTAGNASGINDAAAAVVLMSREKADQLGLDPVVSIKSYASGAVDPAYMGLGVVPSVRKALDSAGLSVEDMEVIELNEAFAAQAIACMRELGLSLDNTNVHGSGVSLGHPIGCTGARLVVTIMHEMQRRDHGWGLVTMCIGGGQGMAAVLSR